MMPVLAGLVDGVVAQGRFAFETDAIVSAVFVFLVSLLIGAGAIHVSARLLIDRDTGFVRAVVTALVGAAVYTLIGLFLGWIPLLGPLLMLLAWVAVVNWLYPGGWVTAIGIGLLAWVLAVLVLFAFSRLGVVTPEALGVPGASVGTSTFFHRASERRLWTRSTSAAI